MVANFYIEGTKPVLIFEVIILMQWAMLHFQMVNDKSGRTFPQKYPTCIFFP